MATEDFEQRMTELEYEVAALRKQVAAITSTKPWWERIAGTYTHDPVYKRAMGLGRQYRRTQQPNGTQNRKKF